MEKFNKEFVATGADIEGMKRVEYRQLREHQVDEVKLFLEQALSRIARETLEAVEIGKILSNLRTAKVWELVPDVPRKIMISDKDLDNLMVSAIEQFEAKVGEFLKEK